jgi:hypothetical protein
MPMRSICSGNVPQLGQNRSFGPIRPNRVGLVDRWSPPGWLSKCSRPRMIAAAKFGAMGVFEEIRRSKQELKQAWLITARQYQPLVGPYNFSAAAHAYQVAGCVRFQFEASLAVVVDYGLTGCDNTHIPCRFYRNATNCGIGCRGSGHWLANLILKFGRTAVPKCGQSSRRRCGAGASGNNRGDHKRCDREQTKRHSKLPIMTPAIGQKKGAILRSDLFRRSPIPA